MSQIDPRSRSSGELSHAVIEYVLSRMNEDGGYTFVIGNSNAQDTYYAIEIFRLLSADPPKIEKTIEWLHAFPAGNIIAHYYITKALSLCQQTPDPKALKLARSLYRPSGGFGTLEADIETPSEFETTFMATDILRTFSSDIDRNKLIDWLLYFQRSDGAFGARASYIASTYYVAATLNMLGYSVKTLNRTLSFVRNCEYPFGGFSTSPGVLPPYMEDTYYGISTLNLMGESSRYPEETTRFVLRFQNRNGGFRRSEVLGISTFENTFQALSVLDKLGKLERETAHRSDNSHALLI